jgi:hypothetical protein
MPRYWTWGIVFASLLCGTSPTAWADCTEIPRKVQLHKTQIAELSSYKCSVGDAPAQLKIETFQLNDVASSIIIGRGSSKLLRKTLGNFRLVKNDVYKNFAGLLKEFGVLEEVPSPRDVEIETALTITGSNPDEFAAGDDVVQGKKVRLFTNESIIPLQYPNISDINSLIIKVIPDNLNFYHAVTCDDEDSEKDPCPEYKRGHTLFWRYLSQEDLSMAEANLSAFNSQLKAFVDKLANRHPDAYGDDPWQLSSEDLDRTKRLVDFISGGTWPDKFFLIYGSKSELGDGCDETYVPGIEGWEFTSYARSILLDVLIIENISKVPLSLDGLLGTSISEPRLRIGLTTTQSTDTTIDMPESLGPGERLLVPVRISFSTGDLNSVFDHPITSRKIYEESGVAGFTGHTDGYGAPSFESYVFGTELAVTGLIVDGQRVEFRPDPNFVNLTIGSGLGSCPYLLSWDGFEKEWVEHGKVLHEAPDQTREYTESITLPGFRSRFRLVEREAELASIDAVELAVVLKGGTTLFLGVDQKALAAKDRSYLRIAWGEMAEFTFDLPDGVAPDEIVQSNLNLTGYYERYAKILAQQASLMPQPKRRVLQGKQSSMCSRQNANQ